MDGTIPRRALPGVLEGIARLSQQYDLRVANVFHAGDGNMHPLILFDANEPGEFARAEELGGKILELCVEVGGSISGEHGIGREKSIKCAPSSTAMKSRPSMRSRRRLTPMVC
ncbi:FAD-linked oxidase C-terminal domain-containing protein [Escherichia coli]|nr:FAD-linked oxidase C-terminal domain-containing protein [Escherichia coli]